MHVVVVESPAKAKTINTYLGSNYRVLASVGHVRDLPSKDGSVLPDKDFAMVWHTGTEGAKRLKSIADAVKTADTLILATDPDREGEAISWHVLEALSNRKALRGKTVQRVAFNAITKTAVRAAMEAPRDLDRDLVDAYLARRALDYLVGFTLSPVLWRKLPGSRSAGRVQSVSLRLIVDREREIEAFVRRDYWTIETEMAAGSLKFAARLHAMDGNKLGKFDLADEDSARAAAARVQKAKFSVASVDSKQLRTSPPPPFTTSTLQQEAARKLGFDARSTMSAAQRLYEAGHITYMRTDGVQMAEEAYGAARKLIGERFGKTYLPKQPRRYKTKSKNAQEAHEAVRPTEFSRTGSDISGEADQRRLYDLIHMRALASQMQQAVVDRTTVDMSDQAVTLVLRATGQVIVFDGFTKLYREGRDDTEDEADNTLPSLVSGDATEVSALKPLRHTTEPPPRYSESSLVRKMEELGIGRPSTYAATLSTLRDREYVRIDRKRFHPEDKGRLVTLFLAQFFARYVAYDFTADLEERLDLVSDGKLEWKALLRDFWHDFKATADAVSNTDRADIVEALNDLLEASLFQVDENGVADRACPRCENGKLGLKLGRLGAFIGCSAYPECRYTRPLNGGESGDGQSPEPKEERQLGADPATGKDIVVKVGPYGPYVQTEGPDGKPKRASIPKDWDAASVDFDRALALIGLPRDLGPHPDDGEAVLAGIGRYGPYVAHAKVYAPLASADEVFEIGINRAVSVIADKKAKPGKRRATAEPIKNLGAPPDGGEEVLILKGRYGPYAKQGAVNATLPRDSAPEDITMEQALQLIAERRKKAPASRKTQRKR